MAGDIQRTGAQRTGAIRIYVRDLPRARGFDPAGPAA